MNKKDILELFIKRNGDCGWFDILCDKDSNQEICPFNRGEGVSCRLVVSVMLKIDLDMVEDIHFAEASKILLKEMEDGSNV